MLAHYFANIESSFREKAEKLSNSFNEKGGIFVFLHIPKTGGTAVRSYLMDQKPNETSYLGCWKGRKVTEASISDYCEHGTPNKTIVVYEAHGGPPCLFYNMLSNKLGEWRELAEQNQVPFFAFTMVREPISWYQSFYNYFITTVGQNVTEAGFFDDHHMKANMQCAELFGISWRRIPAVQVSYSQCMDALALLKQQMDWVSTTDKFSTELIPLISYLGNFENRNLNVILPPAPRKKKLVLGEFSEKGKEHLRNWTEWDVLLYNDIQGSYDFNNWKDFLDANGALHPVA